MMTVSQVIGLHLLLLLLLLMLPRDAWQYIPSHRSSADVPNFAETYRNEAWKILLRIVVARISMHEHPEHAMAHET